MNNEYNIKINKIIALKVIRITKFRSAVNICSKLNGIHFIAIERGRLSIALPIRNSANSLKLKKLYNFLNINQRYAMVLFIFML